MNHLHPDAHEANANAQGPNASNERCQCSSDEELGQSSRCPGYDCNDTLSIRCDVVVVGELLVCKDNGHDTSIVAWKPSTLV